MRRCISGKLGQTHVVEYPVQFVVQPIRKAREQASSPAEHHITQQNLANIGIA